VPGTASPASNVHHHDVRRATHHIDDDHTLNLHYRFIHDLKRDELSLVKHPEPVRADQVSEAQQRPVRLDDDHELRPGEERPRRLVRHPAEW
jgi:hypothetical protein